MTPADLDAFLRLIALPSFVLGFACAGFEPHRDDPALAPTIAKELAHAVRTGERLARRGGGTKRCPP